MGGCVIGQRDVSDEERRMGEIDQRVGSSTNHHR